MTLIRSHRPLQPVTNKAASERLLQRCIEATSSVLSTLSTPEQHFNFTQRLHKQQGPHSSPGHLQLSGSRL